MWAADLSAVKVYSGTADGDDVERFLHVRVSDTC